MINKIFSRYGEPRYITDHGGGWFTIEGKSHFYRCGGHPDIDYLDFAGGPFLQVGSESEWGIIRELIAEPTESGYFKVRFRTGD